MHLCLHSFYFNSKKVIFYEKKVFKSDEALMVVQKGLEKGLVVFVSGICLVLKMLNADVFTVIMASQHQFECFKWTCWHSLWSEKSQLGGKYIELPHPIVSLLCHMVEHDHEHCAATEWHPSHGLHICDYSPHPPFKRRLEHCPETLERKLAWTNTNSDFTKLSPWCVTMKLCDPQKHLLCVP